MSPKLYQIKEDVDVLVFKDCACFITELCVPFANRYSKIILDIKANLENKETIEKKVYIKIKRWYWVKTSDPFFFKDGP